MVTATLAIALLVVCFLGKIFLSTLIVLLALGCSFALISWTVGLVLLPFRDALRLA